MSYQEVVSRIEEAEKRLPSEQAEYLKQYLSNAPYWVFEAMQVSKKEKNVVFIEENTPADYVYILLDGTIRAMDYRIRGVAYDYMRLSAVHVFGAMEGFFKMNTYMTTLETATPCTFLVLSKKNYEKWIWEDKNALRMEVQSMGSYLLEQTRVSRLFLFLQGTDRIMYMFVKHYEKSKAEGDYVVELSRQELAERSGFSIKTINRSIKKLEEDGYISRKGHKIIMSHAQYVMMKEYLNEIVDQTDG